LKNQKRDFSKALDITKKKHGENIEVATIEINFAGLYQQNNKHEEALLHYLSALKILLKVIGINHSSVAVILSDISMLMSTLSKIDIAEETYALTLEVFHLVYGKDHPQTAKTLYNIGMFYKNISKLDLALINFQQSLLYYKNSNSEKDPTCQDLIQELEKLNKK